MWYKLNVGEALGLMPRCTPQNWTYWSMACSPSTEGCDKSIKTSRSFFTIWHLGLFKCGGKPYTFYYEQLRQIWTAETKTRNGMHTSEREGTETESAAWQNGLLISMDASALGFEFHLQSSTGFEISLSSNFIITSGQCQYTWTLGFFCSLELFKRSSYLCTSIKATISSLCY